MNKEQFKSKKEEIYNDFINQASKNIDVMIMQTFEIPTHLGWLKPKTYDEQGLPMDYEADMVENIDNLTESQCRRVADVVSNETKQVKQVMSEDEFTKKFCL